MKKIKKQQAKDFVKWYMKNKGGVNATREKPPCVNVIYKDTNTAEVIMIATSYLYFIPERLYEEKFL
ncbi:hypothetical protein P5667_15640 [Bacillus velezensis]|uniref:hypothetical protein n=1 Tax=Bacillus amyloliquefaciens group TaxID=1938374 RepID=UPI0003965275|nr:MULTISPECIES: hypothetical protein [Bacillus amyloliquefaciens group]ERH55282.1 hypothetical protein O205_21200 [Bacillus amyloliquefaciens EGD-AQ14]MDH3087220.1 hypothetical protein [Bacillus velezensis]WEY80396.1 hypothetical protein P5667_15640 [Bacillus velezensis]